MSAAPLAVFDRIISDRGSVYAVSGAPVASRAEIDGRLVLAGEHASYVGCWQEGALLSSVSAITRLHQRAIGAV